MLLGSIDAALAASDRAGATVPTTWREADEELAVTVALGALHADGQALDWARLHPQPGAHVDLPAYPWQRERHWLDAPTAASSAGHGPREDDAARLAGAGGHVHRDHRVGAHGGPRAPRRRAFAHRIGGSPSVPAWPRSWR